MICLVSAALSRLVEPLGLELERRRRVDAPRREPRRRLLDRLLAASARPAGRARRDRSRPARGSAAPPSGSPTSTDITSSRSATVRASAPIVDQYAPSRRLDAGQVPLGRDAARAPAASRRRRRSARARESSRRSPTRSRTQTCPRRPPLPRRRSSRRPSAWDRPDSASPRTRGSRCPDGRRARRCSSCRSGSLPPRAAGRRPAHRAPASRPDAAATPRTPEAPRWRSPP